MVNSEERSIAQARMPAGTAPLLDVGDLFAEAVEFVL